MVTIVDVAKRAGVSVATVSRALNNTPEVSEEKLMLVMNAVKELNYKPLKKSSGSTGSNLIIVFCGFINDSYISPLKKSAVENGYQIVFYYYNKEDSTSELNYMMSTIMPGHIAGIILCGVVGNADFFAKLASKYPVVTLQNTPLHLQPFFLSTNDEYQMSCILTQHLIDQGKKNIAYVSTKATPKDFFYHHSIIRLHGFEDTLELNGMKKNDNMIIRCDVIPSDGVNVADQILSMNSRPDAVICEMATNAAGLRFEFLKQGIKIPEEIAIVTYDNEDYLEYTDPAITALYTGTNESCSSAVQMITDANTGKYPNGCKMFSTPELIIRDSSMR